MGKKQNKSTPRTTTITPTSLATSLTSFAPAHLTSVAKTSLYYAHLLRAPDAHTLRVYETNTGKCVSRWASNSLGEEDDEQRVASLAWTLLPGASVGGDAEETVTGEDGAAEGKRGKKRRKSDSGNTPVKPTSSTKVNSPKLVLALGLENGSILLWSPTGASSTTLSHSSITTSVTALSTPINGEGHLWAAYEDGFVRVWDLATSTLIGRTSTLVDGVSKWDDLAVRYLSTSDSSSSKRQVQLIVSHLSLHVFSLSLGSPSKKDKIKELKTVEIGRCTGHVDVGSVEWTGKSSIPTEASSSAMQDDDDDQVVEDVSPLTFLSYSSTDRFVQIWSLPLGTNTTRTEGTLLARLSLDSGVQTISLGSSSSSSEIEQVLAAVDTVGKVSLARLPFEFVAPAGEKKKKSSGVAALAVESEIVGKEGEGVGVAAVSVVEGGKVVVCRGGVKPVFEGLAFADESGAWIAKIELEKASAGLLNGVAEEENAGAPAPTRYNESSTSAVRSAEAIADVDSDDDLVNSGELDVDMAEPTLADRLKAMNVNKQLAQQNDGSDDDESADEEDEDDEEAAGNVSTGPIVPATTLTTTLIQALHSSDGPLLESCLNHTSPVLIRSTVKRLPSGSLVLGLLEALVERLGTGKKGTQGNASVKRARGLIEWVRQVLIVHVGFLVTIPSLVTRLATLHSSLTSRLALQPTLLALNGRLELVMSQIDLRQERAAQRAQLVAAAAPTKASGGAKYVEGESDSESGSDDEDEEDELEGMSDDEGSVEDVVLGSGDEELFDDEEEIDDDGMGFDDDDEEGGAPNGVAGLLELEASESEGSEGESDQSEDEESD